MKKRFLFMLFFLFFLMGIAWSQTGTVKGTVTSGEDGLPVPEQVSLQPGRTIGVSMSVKVSTGVEVYTLPVWTRQRAKRFPLYLRLG